CCCGRRSRRPARPPPIVPRSVNRLAPNVAAFFNGPRIGDPTASAANLRGNLQPEHPMPKPLSLAIVGAGIGGLAVAATLRRFGMEARIYEQAPRFARIGAGIQMMPNSMKVLRQIGIEDSLRRISFAPYSHLNRVWDTGEVRRELPMPESLYG